MTRETYEEARKNFWNHQRAFRDFAITEIQRRMPKGVETIVLEINDTPRLTVLDLLTADGASVLEDYDASAEYEVLDDIANDMEAYTWDEAASFLDNLDGDRLSIGRVSA